VWPVIQTTYRTCSNFTPVRIAGSRSQWKREVRRQLIEPSPDRLRIALPLDRKGGSLDRSSRLGAGGDRVLISSIRLGRHRRAGDLVDRTRRGVRLDYSSSSVRLIAALPAGPSA
jgi:hypothetical protein